MICGQCRKAGEWNKTASEMPEENVQRTHYFLLASESHSMCQYPGSCYCQHRVGSGWVQNDEVRASS